MNAIVLIQATQHRMNAINFACEAERWIDDALNFRCPCLCFEHSLKLVLSKNFSIAWWHTRALHYEASGDDFTAQIIRRFANGLPRD
jgi:hypothetical protein